MSDNGNSFRPQDRRHYSHGSRSFCNSTSRYQPGTDAGFGNASPEERARQTRNSRYNVWRHSKPLNGNNFHDFQRRPEGTQPSKANDYGKFNSEQNRRESANKFGYRGRGRTGNGFGNIADGRRNQQMLRVSNCDQPLNDVSSKFSSLKLGTERAPVQGKLASQSSGQNFRQLDLYPSADDLTRKQLDILEPNKISGAYADVENYLNVQFRLLREDFMASVRKGLQQYAQFVSDGSQPLPRGVKFDGVRLYPETRFERIRSSKNNNLGMLLNFDPQNKMRNVRWKESKRFMYGSLLLFTTHGDFGRHFFCCTVVERDIEALKRGHILVSMSGQAKSDQRFFGRKFLMAECEAFFEPYYLVMKLLKEFDKTTFPMRRYIVDGATQAKLPAYLIASDVLKVCDRIVAPITLEEGCWPAAHELRMDRSQYDAFKAALTRDLCVIQGPPGTGKTFIGLKIAQNIWHNAKEFNRQLRLPILVVCAANHALDQFLEGVLRFTTNIVRVGGQSRSELLKPYNVRERARRESRFVTDRGLRYEIKSCQGEIDRIGVQMKCIEQPAGILRARLLQPVVPAPFQPVVADDAQLNAWLLADLRCDSDYAESQFKELPLFGDGRMPWSKVQPRYDHDEGGDGGDDDDDDDDDDGVEAVELLDGADDDDDDDAAAAADRNRRAYEAHVDGCYSVTLVQLLRSRRPHLNRYQHFIRNERRIVSEHGHHASFYERKDSAKRALQRELQPYYALKKNLDTPLHNKDRINAEGLLRHDPMKLTSSQRWLIYWSWSSDLLHSVTKRLLELERAHSGSVKVFEEGRRQQDLAIMRNADVIGMTTSGAARWNSSLKSLQPAVVIIEEAGEVLETHVVASLTNKCEHLILIGDHEQLRPITAVYELSKKYNMNVSLFERMVNNGMECPMLKVQHRMRPEIACLITPLFYQNLKNSDSVKNLESIRGVCKNVFFIDHNEFEQVIRDSASKQNEHEARFVLSLAKYLIQQGYEAKQITILATYSGQRFLLRNLQKEYLPDQRVKCVVVDKYQGEENDIILLSLVRSNANGNIGFLDTKNRVCVALSRAKKGFYMVGNMDCLTKNCDMWQNIKNTLVETDAIGNALLLYCSTHDEHNSVACADDFHRVSNGGCDVMCNVKMKCGHICKLRCHALNRDHPQNVMQCPEKCNWKCPQCKTVSLKSCWEKSKPCSTKVPKVIPECQHEVVLQCCVQPKREHCNQKSCAVTTSHSIPNRSCNNRSTIRAYNTVPAFTKHLCSFTAFATPRRRQSVFSACSLL